MGTTHPSIGEIELFSTLEELVGANIEKVGMDDSFLKFWTDKGEFLYMVEGDCCSWSYFHDFVGVGKLIDNGPVLSTREVSVECDDDGYLQAYGFEIVTEHPLWGEQTSVVSFRNESNGYYGGWMTHLQNPDVANPAEIDDAEGLHYKII